MKETTAEILNELTAKYSKTLCLKDGIESAFKIMLNTYYCGGTIYICGNGGSCADAEHIVGELMKSFKTHRNLDNKYSIKFESYGELGKQLMTQLEAGIPAINLCNHTALNTAFLNDKNPFMCYAQQLNVLGKPNDCLLAISTSGNAKNCIYASVVARAKGIKVIALSGNSGGKLKEFSDCSIIVEEKETYKIQELHLPIYHCLCAMLENEIFA